MNPLALLDTYGTRGDQLWYVAHPVHPLETEVAAWRARESEVIAWHRQQPGHSPGYVVENRKTDREIQEEIVRDNVRNAKHWLAWLIRQFPTITFVAPWIATLDDGGDDDLDPEQRARGLRDCRRTITRCDGMVHVGGRVSAGMAEEGDHALVVVDLTFLGRSPPIDGRDPVVPISTTIVDQPPPVHRPGLIPVWENVIHDFSVRYEDAIQGIDDDLKPTAWNVVNDMRERDRLGRERYGEPLTVNNGRDQLVDAYQELLDAAVYLRAAWLEGSQVSDTYYGVLDSIMKTRTTIDAGTK